MSVLSAIEKRREITAFKPDPIPKPLLDTIIHSLYFGTKRK